MKPSSSWVAVSAGMLTFSAGCWFEVDDPDADPEAQYEAGACDAEGVDGFDDCALIENASTRVFTLENPENLGSNIRQGGFSGLTYVPGDFGNVFYTVTDRGPNGLVSIGGQNRRTFPLLGYTPTILRIRLRGDSISILDRIPIRRPDGARITSLPNLPGIDETPWDRTGTMMLPFDPHGLDPEGIAYNPADRTFWLCEEYETLVHVDRRGMIIERLVPEGRAALLGTDYARDALPRYYGARPSNRGFEGIAITPNGRALFVVQQAPLNNPSVAVGSGSRIIRILKLDLRTETAVAEYLYVSEDAKELTGVLQADVSLSDIQAVNEDTLIVVERDKNAGPLAQLKHIYLVDLRRATNTLDWSSVNDKSLEARTAEELSALRIEPVRKRLLVDILATIPGFPHEKVEGLYVRDRRTVYFCIDNDFGVLFTGPDFVQTGQPTQCYQMTSSRYLF